LGSGAVITLVVIIIIHFYVLFSLRKIVRDMETVYGKSGVIFFERIRDVISIYQVAKESIKELEDEAKEIREKNGKIT
jgi:hypothetical protein